MTLSSNHIEGTFFESFQFFCHIFKNTCRITLIVSPEGILRSLENVLDIHRILFGFLLPLWKLPNSKGCYESQKVYSSQTCFSKLSVNVKPVSLQQYILRNLSFSFGTLFKYPHLQLLQNFPGAFEKSFNSEYESFAENIAIPCWIFIFQISTFYFYDI